MKEIEIVFYKCIKAQKEACNAFKKYLSSKVELNQKTKK